MDKLIEMCIASGISLGVFGFVSFILWVVFIKKYIADLERKSLERGRAAFVRLERRIEAIEQVGLNVVWRDSISSANAEIFAILDKVRRELGELSTLPRQLDRVENKLDRHIENDK